MLFFQERIHVAGCYTAQEVNVLVGMKLRHFTFCGRFGSLCQVRMNDLDTVM